jgi:hypothetical protein
VLFPEIGNDVGEIKVFFFHFLVVAAALFSHSGSHEDLH